ncbi:hypothetical protein ACEWY4_027368 [Coilia grayii]|uniref:CCHC-type domain-containing protein n=1 Tax=Coilia grayii TaxID=363190 RepID=A0ABD1IS70_9TELE
MEEELQQLKEMVLQLKADNDRLRQEQNASQSSLGAATTAAGEANVGPSAAVGVVGAERLVVIPRDRKCPMFNGKTGMGIAEWVEEVQAGARARHLTGADQAFFIFDHLEGEAKEEIRFRSSAVRKDPEKILAVLKELYGCNQSYVTLQQAFFSRQQQEGETLQEFSLGLLALMEQVKQRAPDGIPNAEVLLRDQFAEHVLDNALRRELKQFIRRQPTATLLDTRKEAIRWEQEGLPGGSRGRSFSLPSAYGLQYAMQGRPSSTHTVSSEGSEFKELKEMLKRQQDQLNQLTHTVASLQGGSSHNRPRRGGPVICLRCQQPGHFARECDGERVPSRPRANSISGMRSQAAGLSHPSDLSEN